MKKSVRWRDVKAELLKNKNSQSGYEIACKRIEEFIKEFGEKD